MAYTNDQIGGFFQQYLGRQARPGETEGWLNNPEAESMIRGSGEAQEFAKTGQASTGWSGTPTQTQAQPEAQTQDWAKAAPTTPTGQSGQLTYGSGAAYNAPGGLQDQFWKTMGVVGGGGTLTSDMLRAKEADLAKLGITVHRSTSGDNIRLPDGTLVDVISDAGGKNEAVWQDPRYTAEGGIYRPGVGGGGGGVVGSVEGGGGYQASGGSGNGFLYGTGGQRDELYNELVNRSRQTLNINPMTDANIRAQADPYAAAVERERRRYMADTAERMGPLANLQGESRLASERAGQASAGMEAELIGREMQARRDEIQHALDARRGMLSQEQQLAMQRELANIDAAIRNRQISAGNEQFLSKLGLESEGQANYWDAVRSGLIRG